ncbi:MAG: beta-ketoacyl-[acyl-carrier-protein] synthase family protein [Desulfobacteraceae bacterium]|nr:beta-ketoacyl-[acyl-carrier-protein] synthase family protein [Desulfobacteraceae bacterium]
MARRVVITSMGIISCLGNDPQDIAAHVRSEKKVFRQDEFDPSLVVAPVAGFDPRQHTGRFKNLRYLNRGAAFAVSSAFIAVSGSGLSDKQLNRAGLFAGAGPNFDLGRECPRIEDGKICHEAMSALWMLRFLPNTASAVISRLTGVHGENLTVATACAASLQAIGEAYRKIKDGYLELALAGGGDSRLNPGGTLAYQMAQALYRGPLRPEEASRPFDRNRQGFIPGEGGAFFVLESLEHAAARGADILAEVTGYGSALDAHAMTAPHPGGCYAEKAVKTALKQAGLYASDIDLVSSHGTGTPLNDDMEAELINRLFGAKPTVLALKSWIGHLASACGAVELALCLCSLKTGVWPWIRNLDKPCHPALNFLLDFKITPPETILLQNFGFGGQNAAMVIRAWV